MGAVGPHHSLFAGSGFIMLGRFVWPWDGASPPSPSLPHFKNSAGGTRPAARAARERRADAERLPIALGCGT